MNRKDRSPFAALRVFLSVSASGALLAGCAAMNAAGPSSRAVQHANNENFNFAGIRVVDVTDTLAQRLMAQQQAATFSQTFEEAPSGDIVVGKGDYIDISIWEAPPATLFGANNNDLLLGGNTSSARQTVLPGQMVDSDGQVIVPFIGAVRAAGLTPRQIGNEIVRRLQGKAHMPQAIVKLTDNAATNVTVIGDVAKNLRMPLTSKRERLLDAIAAAGGSRNPIGKTSLQVTRGHVVATLPMDMVVKDPAQNILLQADDVVTVLYQPYSFTALGAIGKNNEIDFEGNGITLAQALGRIGGLDDSRASARGVFIFRLEDKAALGLVGDNTVRTTADGKVPVIFRTDLHDPATFFAAQNFPIKNKDVLYVSNAPLADIQKFVNLVASLAYPIVNVQNATR